MLRQTRQLPSPTSLEEAVQLVIESNKADDYVPRRFIPMVKGKSGQELLQICEHLITNGQTLEHIDKAFIKYPHLLTIEDFVARSGVKWGFSVVAIEAAQDRSIYFDQLSGGQRYA